MARASWDEVSQLTIQKCFKHAGFIIGTEEESTNTETGDADVDNLFDKFADMANEANEMSIEDYINVDQAVQTTQAMTLQDIAAEEKNETENIADKDDDDDDEPVAKVSSKTALQGLAQVRAFVMQQAESASSSKALQDAIALKNSLQGLIPLSKKQTKIDFFFKQTSHPSK